MDSFDSVYALVSKMTTVAEGDQKAPFSIATTSNVGEGTTPFPGLPHFTLDTYLILLSVKQGGIKYHFKSLWYCNVTALAPTHVNFLLTISFLAGDQLVVRGG